jgi:hypothetical protein
VALLYLDASALVKLVRAEPETDALRSFLSHADLLSSEPALTEVPHDVQAGRDLCQLLSAAVRHQWHPIVDAP